MLKVWAVTLFNQRLEPVNRLTDSGQSRAGTGRSGHAVGEWAWGHTTASPTAGLEMWATKSRKVYPGKSDMFRRSVLPWVPRLITVFPDLSIVFNSLISLSNPPLLGPEFYFKMSLLTELCKKDRKDQENTENYGWRGRKHETVTEWNLFKNGRNWKNYYQGEATKPLGRWSHLFNWPRVLSACKCPSIIIFTNIFQMPVCKYTLNIFIMNLENISELMNTPASDSRKSWTLFSFSFKKFRFLHHFHVIARI